MKREEKKKWEERERDKQLKIQKSERNEERDVERTESESQIKRRTDVKKRKGEEPEGRVGAKHR